MNLEIKEFCDRKLRITSSPESFRRRRSRKLTHPCSREVTYPAEGRKDLFSKKERFGSEEGDSEQASWHPEREAGSAGRISGCADATDRSSLWRRDAGAGLSDEARSCVGPWRRQWDRRQSRSGWAGLVRPAR